jgi:hypothetical protein
MNTISVDQDQFPDVLGCFYGVSLKTNEEVFGWLDHVYAFPSNDDDGGLRHGPQRRGNRLQLAG